MYQKWTDILSCGFNNHPRIEICINRAFTQIINNEKVRYSAMFAKDINSLIQKDRDVDAITSKMDNIILLFRFRYYFIKGGQFLGGVLCLP